MGSATDLQSASQGLAVGVSMIALFLGLRQWYERRARLEPSECHVETAAEQAFHRRQDVRRGLGVLVLAALAVLVFAGSWVPPRIHGKGNLGFIGVWLAVMALVVLALVVALWDWIATWRFARSRRQAMLDDHVEELRVHLRAAAEARRGRGDSGEPEPGAPEA